MYVVTIPRSMSSVARTLQHWHPVGRRDAMQLERIRWRSRLFGAVAVLLGRTQRALDQVGCFRDSLVAEVARRSLACVRRRHLAAPREVAVWISADGCGW